MIVFDVDDEALTVPLDEHVVSVRGGRLSVIGGTESIRVGMDRLLVGRSRGCGLVLNDPTVSKTHLELQATAKGVRVVDLKSANGTTIGGVTFCDSEVFLTGPCELQLGAKRLRFDPEPAEQVVVRTPQRFGALVGGTPEMLELFDKLRRYAPTDMPVVIHGETGTGKELVAKAIHEASPRRGNTSGVRTQPAPMGRASWYCKPAR